MTYGPEDRVIAAQRASIRAKALTVPCEELRCGAPVGEPCRNVINGAYLDETSHQPAHSRRLRDSGAM